MLVTDGAEELCLLPRMYVLAFLLRYVTDHVAASAFSDFALAIYPLRTIAGLQMPRKVKVGLSCVLSLGIV